MVKVGDVVLWTFMDGDTFLGVVTEINDTQIWTRDTHFNFSSHRRGYFSKLDPEFKNRLAVIKYD